MKTKKWLSVMIVAGWMIGASAQAQQPIYQPVVPAPSPLAPDAQQPSYQPTYPAPSPLTPNAVPEIPPPAVAAAPGVLSDWIVYRRQGCEGHPGPITPLYTELFVASGPSFPVGGMTLSRELKTGWSFMGGARALIFNEEQTKAWVVNAHIINTHESGGKQDTAFPMVIFNKGAKVVFGPGGIPGATIQDSNRTMVGLGFGREWFPWQPANADGCKWRFGVDGGGRYGSHRINFNEVGHNTDVIGGVYAAIHSDVEIPVRWLLMYAGFRLEWAYTWSDILQRTSDVQDINLFLTVGARY